MPTVIRSDSQRSRVGSPPFDAEGSISIVFHGVRQGPLFLACNDWCGIDEGPIGELGDLPVELDGHSRHLGIQIPSIPMSRTMSSDLDPRISRRPPEPAVPVAGAEAPASRG